MLQLAHAMLSRRMK